MSRLELLRTAAVVISPVLVVIGWWWVNRQQNERESRKETRQLVDRVQGSVRTAFDCATQFHSSPRGSSETGARGAWQLLLAINQVKSQLILLAQNGMATQSCIGPFNRLKRTATGCDFMTQSYKSWPETDARWMELVEATDSLMHQLDVLFFDKFGPKDN